MASASSDCNICDNYINSQKLPLKLKNKVTYLLSFPLFCSEVPDEPSESEFNLPPAANKVGGLLNFKQLTRSFTELQAHCLPPSCLPPSCLPVSCLPRLFCSFIRSSFDI